MGRSPGDEGERVDLVSIREGEVRERREGVRRETVRMKRGDSGKTHLEFMIVTVF